MSTKKSFLLRINPGLYEVLERWAADEFRSVNAQIEFILRDAAFQAGRISTAKARAEMEQSGQTDEVTEKK
jgi:hypothetical protein